MDINSLQVNPNDEYTYSQEYGLQAYSGDAAPGTNAGNGVVVTGSQVEGELKSVNSFGKDERQEMQQMFQEMIQQEQQENNEGNDAANPVSVIN